MPEIVVLDPANGLTPRQNLATNPKAGALATTGWTNTGLTAFAAVTLGAGGAPAPSAALIALGVKTGFHVTGDAAADRASIPFDVVSGETYTVAVYLYLDTHTTAGVQLRVDNAAAASKASTVALVTDDVWTRQSVTFTADSTGTWRLRVQQSAAGAADFYFSAVLIEHAATLGGYFDGGTLAPLPTATYRWEGTPHASISSLLMLRAELDLTDLIGDVGPDWGDAEIEAYMAEASRGQLPVDFRMPNRQIQIPLVLRDLSDMTFEEARQSVQAKVGLFQREGGWLKRQTGAGHWYADIVNASLKLGGGSAQALLGIDADAVLTFETLPDFYGDEIQLDDMTGTGELVGVLKQGGVNALITGDHPGRVRIAATDLSGQNQVALMWGLRSENYSPGPTAALVYEAELLTPMDAAAVASQAGASGAGSNVIRHSTLSTTTNWVPVLSTTVLSGALDLTHRGTYRVWARVYAETTDSLISPPKVRLVWDVGDLVQPVENPSVTIPTPFSWFAVDLGEIRLDAPPVGAHRWRGIVQALGAVGANLVAVDKVWLVPIDEGYGVLRGMTSSVEGLGGDFARDGFAQSAGALAGKTAPIGGVWAASGSATDLAVEAAGHTAQRSSLDASIPHFDTLPTNRTGVLVQADFKSTLTASGPATEHGIVARYVDTSNYLYLVFEVGNLLGGATFANLTFRTKIAGSTSGPSESFTTDSFVAGRYYSLRLTVDALGQASAWAWETGTTRPVEPTLSFTSPDLATGGALASGLVGIRDQSDLIAVTRNYDNFYASPIVSDAVLFASQSAELRTDGMFREDSTGIGYGTVSQVVGDLPRLPPSGLEGRPVELFVKPTRGDLAVIPDTGIDDIGVQVLYRPSWLFVPEA